MLFKRVLALQNTNAGLEKQVTMVKKILSDLRLNYFKELNNLRQLNQPWMSRQMALDYLNVKYFSGIEGMEDNVVEILNTKLAEMKKDFDERIFAMAEDVNEKALKIQAYQELAPSSYGLLDMNLDQIFEGVRAMEKDPSKIWRAMVKAYTRQFFDTIIENEYRDYLNEVSTREMIRSINKIKKEMTDQIADVKLSMEAEKKSLRYQINMKIEENQYLRSSNITLINRAKKDAHLAAEDKFKERVDQLYKKFDEEKHELMVELKSLKKFAENHNYLKEQMSLKLALVKWRFTIQIWKVKEGQMEKPIKDITDDLRRVVMGKQIQEHEERMKELEHLKMEHDSLKIKNANNIYRMHDVTDQIKLLEKNVQEMQDENGSLSSMLARERQENRALKLEIQSFSNGDKINKEIIEVLENDKESLKQKLEQLSKQLELKDPDFLGAGDLRDKNSRLFLKKALQQMNQEKFESMRQIISEDFREIGTITDMRGIENELVQNAYNNEDSDLPYIPKLNAITQTDKELYQNMSPDIPLSDVKAYHKINALENELKRIKKKKGIHKDSRMLGPSDDENDFEISSSEASPEIKIKKKSKNKIKTNGNKQKDTLKTIKTKHSIAEGPKTKISLTQNDLEDVEDKSLDRLSNEGEEAGEKNGYNISFDTKTKFKQKTQVFKSTRPEIRKLESRLTPEELEAAEEEIDRNTVIYIFKLKQNNPQINPEIFSKAIEYIRMGAQKKLRLRHYESSEMQMARLYPSNQPKVFNRLWGEVNKRKLKHETLQRLSQKEASQRWINKLKEVKRTVWSRLLSTQSEINISEEHQYFNLNRSKSNDKKSTIKFPNKADIERHKHASSVKLDNLNFDKTGLLISQANMSMLNPNKIRESSFITDFVRSHMNYSSNEPEPKAN